MAPNPPKRETPPSPLMLASAAKQMPRARTELERSNSRQEVRLRPLPCSLGSRTPAWESRLAAISAPSPHLSPQLAAGPGKVSAEPRARGAPHLRVPFPIPRTEPDSPCRAPVSEMVPSHGQRVGSVKKRRGQRKKKKSQNTKGEAPPPRARAQRSGARGRPAAAPGCALHLGGCGAGGRGAVGGRRSARCGKVPTRQSQSCKKPWGPVRARGGGTHSGTGAPPHPPGRLKASSGETIRWGAVGGSSCHNPSRSVSLQQLQQNKRGSSRPNKRGSQEAPPLTAAGPAGGARLTGPSPVPCASKVCKRRLQTTESSVPRAHH